MTESDTPAVPARLTVRRVPVSTVRPLRHRVLRPGFPESAVHTDRDDAPETVHLSAFDGDEVIGVLTMFAELFPGDPRPALRFRWMAVDETRRGNGIGHALMRHAAAVALDGGFELLWAHGRETALGFYERLGFRSIGDGYTDPVTQIRHRFVVVEADALLDR
ncbi:MAG: GNAT family N-acetyltransferase [Candidatus Dormiibacterota bacterium]